MKKTLFFLSIFIVVGLILGNFAIAQENGENGEEELTESEPTLLPNSPFYFLKSFWRQLRLTFTFDSVNKAELRLQFANEMLAEAQRLAEESDDPEILQKAIDRYEKQVEKLGQRVEKFEQKSEEKVQAFQNRFERKIEVHQRVLNQLQEKLSDNPQAQERVQEVKQRTIQHLNQVKEKLQGKFGQ